ncbi:MAG: hypothetical protein AAFV29_09330 [Myxococcota bacterium]
MAMVVGTASVATAEVRKLDLGELSQRSAMIIRGTVLSMKNTTVAVGGAELPAVTYHVAVNDTLKATSNANFIEKNGKRVAVITMLSSKAVTRVSNNLVRFSKLGELPSLEVGQEYLLMMTGQSAVGLQMTVGTTQGCFHINPKTNIATNALDNRGLSASINGPVAYSVLASAITAAVGQ